MSIASRVANVMSSIEEMSGLDGVSQPIVDWVGKAVRPAIVRNTLSGEVIGHPLHPLLTDVPIGAWTMAGLLDVVGGSSSERAADILVATGIVSALPTAASGLNDWSDTYGPETRVGLVHAGAVTSALVLYTLSARCRARGNRTRGKVLGMVGMGALLAGGYLGGHLSFGKGVNVNRVAWEEGPGDWVAVLPEAELGDGEHRKVDADGTAVLLYRSGSEIWALSNTCSHMGGPLDEGTFADGCVTCPWHGSIFQLRDGEIRRGPATARQPSYETRVNDGQIEVRHVG
ncbi:Rieske 2Fe-2S domain-containing protein [Intrasporangium sp.]|uniref:Rieske 2Fe-2S domain-containing protein n=1 Tax=Intrasporangium sp. TaxID=1925024 RepID=UPI0032215D1E